MSKSQVPGITGLLDGILTPADKPAGDAGRQDVQPVTEASSERLTPSTVRVRPRVRLGRPPGRSRTSQPKEKLTVWVERSLIDSYREWTWQARCQLSHLVERALVAYHEQHSNELGPEC